jgi:hypothetical protein
VTADTWAEVRDTLGVISTRFACWARGNGLHINAAKTQVLVSASAGKTADLSVVVDGKTIQAGDTLELLGVRFDRRFTTAPHIEHLAAAAKQRAAMISRLAHHVPRGQYLRQLAHGLVFGKLNHALAVAVTPRLTEETPTVGGLRATQISLNKVARSVTGCKMSDHVTVADLNAKARFPLLNELVTRTVAMQTWAAHSSNEQGRRNPLGAQMFKSSGYARYSRAAAAGQVLDRTVGGSLVSTGLGVWNQCPDLRVAATKGAAKRAAAVFARSVPL